MRAIESEIVTTPDDKPVTLKDVAEFFSRHGADSEEPLRIAVYNGDGYDVENSWQLEYDSHGICIVVGGV